ncbi:MAG: hypothetical protein ACRD1E_07880 [Terriglobales bacterium]
MRTLEEVVPDEQNDNVALTGDLYRRRGRIENTEPRAGSQVIRALVPLSDMFGYATEMRSATQGRASYTMHFAHYEEVPKALAEEIMARVQGREVKR